MGVHLKTTTNAYGIMGALVIITAIVIAVVVFVTGSGSTEQPNTAPAFDRSGIPSCVESDGSGQAICFWDSERANGDAIRGDAIVFNSGTTAYYPETGELAVWVDEKNDVEIVKIG